MSKLFDEVASQTPPHVQYFVDMSFDISDRIQNLLEAKGMQQKDLALALGKQESEVSKWLSGTHNFTLKTLAKITSILQADLVKVVNQASTVPGPQMRTEVLGPWDAPKPEDILLFDKADGESSALPQPQTAKIILLAA
ncbi:MAG: helix-turn-helix transcriptional regulator [Bacteroidia bacterium]|nr:helix-turn-helix transcriptional regulator [Bacteroidia bacterium]